MALMLEAKPVVEECFRIRNLPEPDRIAWRRRLSVGPWQILKVPSVVLQKVQHTVVDATVGEILSRGLSAAISADGVLSSNYDRKSHYIAMTWRMNRKRRTHPHWRRMLRRECKSP